MDPSKNSLFSMLISYQVQHILPYQLERIAALGGRSTVKKGEENHSACAGHIYCDGPKLLERLVDSQVIDPCRIDTRVVGNLANQKSAFSYFTEYLPKDGAHIVDSSRQTIQRVSYLRPNIELLRALEGFKDGSYLTSRLPNNYSNQEGPVRVCDIGTRTSTALEVCATVPAIECFMMRQSVSNDFNLGNIYWVDSLGVYKEAKLFEADTLLSYPARDTQVGVAITTYGTRDGKRDFNTKHTTQEYRPLFEPNLKEKMTTFLGLNYSKRPQGYNGLGYPATS
jgi:hypothetical protein